MRCLSSMEFYLSQQGLKLLNLNLRRTNQHYSLSPGMNLDWYGVLYLQLWRYLQSLPLSYSTTI